jgi:hypothetical protein
MVLTRKQVIILVPSVLLCGALASKMTSLGTEVDELEYKAEQFESELSDFKSSLSDIENDLIKQKRY